MRHLCDQRHGLCVTINTACVWPSMQLLFDQQRGLCSTSNNAACIWPAICATRDVWPVMGLATSDAASVRPAASMLCANIDAARNQRYGLRATSDAGVHDTLKMYYVIVECSLSWLLNCVLSFMTHNWWKKFGKFSTFWSLLMKTINRWWSKMSYKDNL